MYLSKNKLNQLVGIVLLGVCSAAFAVTGSVKTTFDASQGGCLDNPNGVNCNNYVSKPDVYIMGGPSQGNSGLAAGDYFFAVIVPGYQNGGFIDGADGNLSDTTAGSTAGDTGGGDLAANRTFHIDATGNVSTYSGNHASSLPGSSNYDASLVSPLGNLLIQLIPYDNTSNPGGVYILAVCTVGANSPNDCKFDAFRIQAGGSEQDPPGTVSGMKYYDANVNGQWDLGEVGISNWPLNYQDADLSDFGILTASDGTFSASLLPGQYLFSETPGTFPWIQTGNVVNQSNVSGSGSVVLNPNKTYTVTVASQDVITGINFGNVCIGKGGCFPKNFWCKLSCKSLFGKSVLTILKNLNLRKANGWDFDPMNFRVFRSWVLNVSNTNMAYALSVELATMKLNLIFHVVSGSALIHAPNTQSANASGFATLNAIMTEANTALGTNSVVLVGNPNRPYLEALKNALDKANNNLNFVQPTPATCPAPPVGP